MDIIVFQKVMVSYLKRKHKKYLYYFMVFIGVILTYLISYLFNYIRFNDIEYVSNKVDKVMVDDLRSKLNELSNSNLLSNGYVLGKVMVRDIYNFYEEIIINVDNEVNIGDGVLNSEGLIGIVSKIDNDRVYVRLLSSKYNVSVKINDCYGNLSNGYVDMVDKDCNIKEGDKVVTSGLNNIVKDIYVGEVMEVSEEELGLIIKVNLINNKYLNYVGVIT